MFIFIVYNADKEKASHQQLQCGHWNWDTWKKIVESQHFLKTKDPQVFVQTDQ